MFLVCWVLYNSLTCTCLPWSSQKRLLITWLNPWCYVLMVSLRPCNVSSKYFLIFFNVWLCGRGDILLTTLDRIRTVVNSKWSFNNVSSPLPFFESARYQRCLTCKIQPMMFTLFWTIAFSSITVIFTWKVITWLMFNSGNNGTLSSLIYCNVFDPSCSGELVILLTRTLK